MPGLNELTNFLDTNLLQRLKLFLLKKISFKTKFALHDLMNSWVLVSSGSFLTVTVKVGIRLAIVCFAA